MAYPLRAPGFSWILVDSLLLIVLFFCAVFLCFVCLRPVSCVSIDCLFLIATLVFSNVYGISNSTGLYEKSSEIYLSLLFLVYSIHVPSTSDDYILNYYYNYY